MEVALSMKRFIIDVYKILYRATGDQFFAVILTVIYITGLNLSTIYGLILLLREIIPGATILLSLFSFPYCFITIAVMFLINCWLLMPFHDLTKWKKIRPMIEPIIVYSLVALMLLLYSCYFGSIF